MLGIGEKLPEFTVTGVKPKFMQHEQNGESAFEPITQDSFEGKWKVIFFYPKDFTSFAQLKSLNSPACPATSKTATRLCSAGPPTTSS